MLEQLELILSECVGESALDSSWVKSFSENWRLLEQEDILLDVIWHLEDALSMVAQKLESLALPWLWLARGFTLDFLYWTQQI